MVRLLRLPCTQLRFGSFVAVSLTLAAASTTAFAAPEPPSDALETTPADTTRQGIVQIERGGRPIAIGTVLGNDGRVLTSFTALSGAEHLELRYADGTLVKTRLGHSNRRWDLALLVPLGGKRPDGLVPSQAAPETSELRSYLPKAGKLSAVNLGFKKRVDARAEDGEPLQGAIEIDLKGSPSVLGAPLLDADGKVLGTLVQVCKDEPDATSVAPTEGTKSGKTGAKTEAKKKAACATMTVAAPVHALRSFLMSTPKEAAQPAPWLGIGGASSTVGNVHGVRVVGVAKDSPAEHAGLMAGDHSDTIVAVDGKPVETPEQLAETIGKRGVGSQVKLLVFRADKFREVSVTLRAAPSTP